jgi:hypothetical protein
MISNILSFYAHAALKIFRQLRQPEPAPPSPPPPPEPEGPGPSEPTPSPGPLNLLPLSPPARGATQPIL